MTRSVRYEDLERHRVVARRRWVQLLEHDDDVEVELILGVFEHLMAEVLNGRPTWRSSRSSR
jgi:hypothetical protein